MKPWREIAVPHKDVLEGSFQQAQFAADLSAVHRGEAGSDYQNAEVFYQRTYITEGMGQLLGSVALRLTGQGADPVIQLQNAFGGGKTHTMLAVYHLATRQGPLHSLQGVSSVLDRYNLLDLPRAKVAVLDGMRLAPGEPQKHGSLTARTLWGELAWQLGGEAAYRLVQASDEQGTSPGKAILQQILQAASPCVILMDELVGYIRQFELGRSYPGGTYESNLSFMQALTEAVKLAPQAVLLASLPDSEGAGEGNGQKALKDLEKIFSRVEALWKPITTEEAFEIVRRRLFQPIHDTTDRDEVCKAFADLYLQEKDKLPSETQEGKYSELLKKAYPVHPEVFRRLYDEWSTLPSFQRTRGTLQLMALVIHRLWQSGNPDYLILPGSLPLTDPKCQSALVKHLPQGWEPVLEKDVDGDRSEAASLEQDTRFGSVLAGKKVSRTIFFATAPGSSSLGATLRGLTTGEILLGCIQPEQNTSVFVDALNRLKERWHYLSTNGDKGNANTRYWFDTRANLRREMEDRRLRFDVRKEIRDRIAQELKSTLQGLGLVDGLHVFAGHADVPDDTLLRLVVLSPEKLYSPQSKSELQTVVQDYLKHNGDRPRSRKNRLLFLAGDEMAFQRVIDQVRTALAWESIVEDARNLRLNVDKLQERQAADATRTAVNQIPGVVRECFKWLLVPEQDRAKDPTIQLEVHPISTGGTAFAEAFGAVCRDNEIILTKWAAVHLSNCLKEYYWTQGPSVSLSLFWDDVTKYPFLRRLRNEGVLHEAVQRGLEAGGFFAYALAKTEKGLQGLTLSSQRLSLDPAGLLIEPSYAQAELQRQAEVEAAAEPAPGAKVAPTGQGTSTPGPAAGTGPSGAQTVATPGARLHTAFHGTKDLEGSAFKVHLTDIAEELLAHLISDPKARVKVTLEIEAEFPAGVKPEIERTVSENARSLGFRIAEWE